MAVFTPGAAALPRSPYEDGPQGTHGTPVALNVSEDGDEGGVSESPQAYRQARVGGALIAAVRNVIAQCRASSPSVAVGQAGEGWL